MTPAWSCRPGSKGAALPGWPRPPQHLAMLRWWARGLFLKEIRVCMEEETELIYFLAFTFVKKSLQICFDQLMQHYISPRLHRESLAKGRADSRGLIRPCLGTRPGQGPSRAWLMTVPLPQGLPGTGFLLAAVRTSPIWVLPERLDGHSLWRAKPFPSHLLMALSWSTSANKPCRKPGWQSSCCPMTTKHLSCDLHDKVESTGKDKPLRQIWP